MKLFQRHYWQDKMSKWRYTWNNNATVVCPLPTVVCFDIFSTLRYTCEYNDTVFDSKLIYSRSERGEWSHIWTTEINPSDKLSYMFDRIEAVRLPRVRLDRDLAARVFWTYGPINGLYREEYWKILNSTSNTEDPLRFATVSRNHPLDDPVNRRS